MQQDEQAIPMNPYELQRQQIIARNRARLLALGIPQAVEGLRKLAPGKKPRVPRPKRPAGPPVEPSRQSSRLRDAAMIARGEVPPGVEEGSELALFIIDGECPRCGKVLSMGHGRHLEGCKGPPEPSTEEEVAAQAEAYRATQKDKLRQLELGGLVDYHSAAAAAATASGEPAAAEQQQQQVDGTPAAAEQQQEQEQKQEEQEEAQQTKKGKGRGKAAAAGKGKGKGKGKGGGSSQAAAAAAAAAAGGADGEAYAIFIVIGSRGDHYAIKLTHQERTCQCLDHRFRRHDCKHIRLILQQLGVEEHPDGWEQALLQQVDALGAADKHDVERVQQAEARAQERMQKAAAKEAAAAAADLDGQREECGDMGEEAAAVAAAGERGPHAQGGKRKAAGRKRKAAG